MKGRLVANLGSMAYGTSVMNDPRILVHSFAIRAHDLDSTGRASVAALIRLLENQRWHALASPQFLGSLFDNGVVRAQSIQLFEPLDFSDEIEIAMWLSSVGRTSMHMGHTLKRKDTGRVLGRAAVAVVAMTRGGRPKPLDEGIRKLLCDEETIAIPRLLFSPAPGAWAHSFPVRVTDLDLLRHVNEARYVDYVEDARHACAAEGGYGSDGRLAVSRIQNLTISYEGQARAGDHLRTMSWALDEGSGRYAFETRRDSDGELVMRAEIQVEV